jgi:chromosome segregation ATPase
VLGLKDQIEKLSKQNQMLQSDLQKLKNELKGRPTSTETDHGPAVEQLNVALMDQAEASNMEMSQIGQRIEPLQADLNQIGELQQQQAEDLKGLNATAQSLTGGIEKNTQSINELAAGISKLQDDVSKPKTTGMAETEEWEEPSKSKRTFAILAALAGGAAFFVVNAVGSSD